MSEENIGEITESVSSLNINAQEFVPGNATSGQDLASEERTSHSSQEQTNALDMHSDSRRAGGMFLSSRTIFTEEPLTTMDTFHRTIHDPSRRPFLFSQHEHGSSNYCAQCPQDMLEQSIYTAQSSFHQRHNIFLEPLPSPSSYTKYFEAIPGPSTNSEYSEAFPGQSYYSEYSEAIRDPSSYSEYSEATPGPSIYSEYSEAIPGPSSYIEYSRAIPSPSSYSEYSEAIPGISSHNEYSEAIPGPSSYSEYYGNIPSPSSYNIFTEDIHSPTSYTTFSEAIPGPSGYTEYSKAIPGPLSSTNSSEPMSGPCYYTTFTEDIPGPSSYTPGYSQAKPESSTCWGTFSQAIPDLPMRHTQTFAEVQPEPSDIMPNISPPATPGPSTSAATIPMANNVWRISSNNTRLPPENHIKRRMEDIELDNNVISKKICKKKQVHVRNIGTKKEHVNIVLIGHVDAGKSTIGGQIMSLTGMVDKRTMHKYEREAREQFRDSWSLSWTLDTNPEEREKGKTVEVGRACFETDKKKFTILDAPGHKSFVPNMIGGAAQADLAILVISARKGEFETGFEKGGQTREHAMLAKMAGVKHLVAVVNKMDDLTVNWDEHRYNECHDKILPFLKKIGFHPAKDLSFLPVSGQTGQGLLQQVSEDVCPWYRGPSFIQLIDELPTLDRNRDGPFIMPVVDKYQDMGTVLMGKVEAGVTRKGKTLLLMPNKVKVVVDKLWCDNETVSVVESGENIKVCCKALEDEDVSSGSVLCSAEQPITTGKVFDAQVVILEHKSIICAGYSAVMHIHCAAEEIKIKQLICLVDKKTGEKSRFRPRFVKQDQVAIMRIECAGAICMEPYKKFAQLGRFTIRDDTRTVAIGKVLKVIQ